MPKSSFPSNLAAAMLCFFSVSMSYAEVSMPSSPIQGNPVDLAIDWSWNTVHEVTLIINAVPGEIQSACYIKIVRQWNGINVTVYETSSGNPENPQFASAGWQVPPLSSSACSVDVASSRWLAYGFVLRITLNPSRIGYNQVVATWDEYMSDGETWWYEWTTATLGEWNSGPPAGPSAVLTQPAPDSVLTSTTATFQWSPAVNAIQYCLDIGTIVGGNNVFTGCGTQLFQTVSNLPSTGLNFYLTLTSNFGGLPSASNQYTVRAADLSLASTLYFPTGRAITGPTMAFYWSQGTNVSSIHTVIRTPKAILFESYTALSANVTIPPGTTTISVQLHSQLPSGEADNFYTFSVIGAADTTPALDVNNGHLSWINPGQAGIVTFYVTAGNSPGSGQIFPGPDPLPPPLIRGNPFTNNSLDLNLNGFRNGRIIYVSLFWNFNDTPNSPWSVVTRPFSTTGFNDPPNPNTNLQMPAVLIGINPQNTTISRSPRSFLWDGGAGVTSYWLIAGSTSATADLYNSFNGRQRAYDPMQKDAYIEAFPDSLSTVNMELYSKIGADWYPVEYTIHFAEAPQPTLQNIIVEGGTNIYGCVGPNSLQPVCTLPAGVFGIDHDPMTQSPFSSGPILIERSGVTLKGGGSYDYLVKPDGTQIISGTGTILLRSGASWPNNCRPLVGVAQGVQNVIIRVITLDGNNRSFTDSCTDPNPNQPDVDDLAITGPNEGSPTHDITVDSVKFSNSSGRALNIIGPNVDTVLVQNSSFVNAALTGLLVYSPFRNGTNLGNCDSRDPVAVEQAVHDVTIRSSQFDRSWTGATAFNYGKNLWIDNSYFYGNYWNPYDDSGGTSFVDYCVRDAKFTNSYFIGDGLTTKTEGLEIHSKGVEITNNVIKGYPNDGISIRRAQDVTLKDNLILNNNRNGYVQSGGVYLQNVASWRTTGNISFEHNTINNSDAALSPSQSWGVRFKNCDPNGTGSCTPTIETVRFINGIDGVAGATGTNNLTGNVSGKGCTEVAGSPRILAISADNNPPDNSDLAQAVRTGCTN